MPRPTSLASMLSCILFLSHFLFITRNFTALRAVCLSLKFINNFNFEFNLTILCICVEYSSHIFFFGVQMIFYGRCFLNFYYIQIIYLPKKSGFCIFHISYKLSSMVTYLLNFFNLFTKILLDFFLCCVN